MNNNKVGVAQVLSRLTNISSLSHARRISTPTDKSGKLIEPRKLHNTTWGFICPVETPEGQSVGVVKNLAVLAHITIWSNPMTLYEYILPYIEILDENINKNININIDDTNLYDTVKVFINGCWIGITIKAQILFESLKKKKYQGIINIYTSIVFNYEFQEIRICNDAGRATRPLLRVIDGKILLTRDIIKKIQSQQITWEQLFLEQDD